jgi:hypothetical protein
MLTIFILVYVNPFVPNFLEDLLPKCQKKFEWRVWMNHIITSAPTDDLFEENGRVRIDGSDS